FKAAEAGCLCSAFAGLEQKCANAAARPVWMNEEGADLGGIVIRIEQVVVPIGPLIGAVQSFSLAPSTARDDFLVRERFRGTIFHNEIGAVGDELRVDAENTGQRTFSLRESVVTG